MNFTKFDFNDKSQYPKKQGLYLLKVFNFDKNGLPEYMLGYFLNEFGYFGFYQDVNCNKDATFEKFFKWIPFEYLYLENLANKEGEWKIERC